MISGVWVFQFCSSSKKATTATATETTPAIAKVTYAADVEPLIKANCAPCHFPPKGNKEPLNTYEAAKENAGEMIKRIQMHPDERGFMPFRHPRLSDSTINVFVQWKQGGLLKD